MHQELVERRRWISENRFLHALNYCMLLPGPEAQQLAVYLGWLIHRTWGGVIAGVLYGIKPAVTAIVVFAAYRIGSRALKNWLLWAMAALAFLAIFTFDAPFPLIVLIAAIFGVIGGKFSPQKFAVGGHNAAKQSFSRSHALRGNAVEARCA